MALSPVLLPLFPTSKTRPCGHVNTPTVVTISGFSPVEPLKPPRHKRRRTRRGRAVCALAGRQGANGQGEEICLLPTSLGADGSLPPTLGTGSNSASELHLRSGPAAPCRLSWDHRYASSFSPAPSGLTGAQGLCSTTKGWPMLQASPTGPSASSHPSQGYQQRPKNIPFSAPPRDSDPNHRTRGSNSCSHLALPRSLGPGQTVLQFPPWGKTSSHITCASATA